jgi:hypothetical protein
VSAVPFSADFPRDQDFALGVIGTAASGFPDTLRQFRVQHAKPPSDSLMPLATDPEPLPEKTRARAAWRLRSFWMSLGVGFGIGALAALFVSLTPKTEAPPPRAATPAAALMAPVSPQSATLPAPMPSCTGSVAVTAPSAASIKVPSTPLLERRFWLERARAAQRVFHLADAERFYRRVLAQAPRDSEALAGLGEVELLRGTVSEADAHFHAALDANPDYVPALVAVADIRWQSGQAQAARDAYRQIVEQYSADSYPPYVVQRSEAACVPQCQP